MNLTGLIEMHTHLILRGRALPVGIDGYYLIGIVSGRESAHFIVGDRSCVAGSKSIHCRSTSSSVHTSRLPPHTLTTEERAVGFFFHDTTAEC